jgi:hypothetical protein
MAVLTRLSLRLVAITAACVLAAIRPDAAPTLTEAQVKAGLLYNFATFVEWPAEEAAIGTPLLACIESADAVADALRDVEGRRVRGRALQVRRMAEGGEPGGCALLFIAETSPRAARLLAELRDAHVLSVGEHEQFSRMGGIVRLFPERSRIRFEIDVAHAERSKLKISSKLLKLARVLRDGNVVTP